MSQDPYEVLGLKAGAPMNEVRAAYRALVELYHPDRLQNARPAVQAEATRRLREAIEALHEIEQRQGTDAGRPVRATHRRVEPLHAVTHSAGGPRSAPLDPFGPGVRIFDAELESVPPRPPFHVRWGGRHARASLAALHRLHHADISLVRQLEWGSYQVELDGKDMVRLLQGVVPEDPGPEEPVSLVAMASSLRERLAQDGEPLPTPGANGPVVPMRRVLPLIDPDGRYTLIADSL